MVRGDVAGHMPRRESLTVLQRPLSMKDGNDKGREAIKTRREIDMLVYKGLRNKVIQELRSAKSRFYVNILNEARGNIKLIWENIDDLDRKSTRLNSSH